MTTSFLHGVEVIEVNDGIRPVRINPTGVIGLIGTAPDASDADWPFDEPILLASQPRLAATLGTTGTLLPAVQQIYAETGASVIVVRVADKDDQGVALTTEEIMSKIVGSAATKTGLFAFLGSMSKYKLKPKKLIAPGFTSQRVSGSPNPVVAAMIPIAVRLRAGIYGDTPSTSYEDAVAWQEDFGSDRVVGFYPSCLVWDTLTSAYVARPQSATQAGLFARVMNEQGFWFSPSNNEVYGVGGVSTPVDFVAGDPNCEANLINQAGIATLINMGGDYSGWRRWGNRTTAADALWVFEAVRTIEDTIYEALDNATYWAVDKPPTQQLLLDVTEMANRFFKYGKSQGFLVGGKCWLDPERNTPEQLAQGIWAWDIDPEAPAPMEHIQYFAHRNTDYYSDLTNSLVSLIAAQS